MAVRQCINRSNKEFKQLVEDMGIKPIILASDVSMWMSTHNQDRFPTKEELENNNITPIKFKKGVKFIFDKHPKIAKIGSKQEYSDYLDTIFPESKVQDVVLHGTPSEITKFEVTENNTAGGIWFTGEMSKAKLAGSGDNIGKVENIYAAKLNIKNPKYKDSDGRPLTINPEKYLQDKDGGKHDAAIFEPTRPKDLLDLDSEKITMYLNQVVVFDADQIHMLGSEDDIKGFKDFVVNNKEELFNEVEQIEPIIEIDYTKDLVITKDQLQANIVDIFTNLKESDGKLASVSEPITNEDGDLVVTYTPVDTSKANSWQSVYDIRDRRIKEAFRYVGGLNLDTKTSDIIRGHSKAVDKIANKVVISVPNELKVAPKVNTSQEVLSPKESLYKSQIEKSSNEVVKLNYKIPPINKSLSDMGIDSSTRVNTILRNKLETWMGALGIDISEMDEMEKKLYSSPLSPKAKANIYDWTIKYANNKISTADLAEEASHFITILVKEGEPGLYTSLINNIVNRPEYQKVLQEYKGVYGENEEAYQIEAIGKVMKDILLNPEKYTKNPQDIKTKTIFDRLKAFLKDLFFSKGISSEIFNEDVKDYVKALEYAEEIATDSSKINVDDIQNKYKGMSFYSLDGNITSQYESHKEWMNKPSEVIHKEDGVYLQDKNNELVKMKESTFNYYYDRELEATKNADSDSFKNNKIHYVKSKKLAQIIGKSIIEGKDLSYKDAKVELYEALKYNPLFKDFKQGDAAFSMDVDANSGVDPFKATKDLVKSIIDKTMSIGEDRAKISDSSLDTIIKFGVESAEPINGVYTELDMVVLYPNGTRGVYEFAPQAIYKKGKDEADIKLNQRLTSGLSDKIRISKEIMDISTDTNINSAESRIIPIETWVDKKGIVKSFTVDTENIYSYLNGINTNDALLSNEYVNDALETLYNEISNLEIKVDKNEDDYAAKHELKELRLIVDSILNEEDFNGFMNEMATMVKRYEYKLNAQSDPDQQMNVDDINMFRKYFESYTSILSGLKSDNEAHIKELYKDKEGNSEIIDKSKILNRRLSSNLRGLTSLNLSINEGYLDLINREFGSDLSEVHTDLSFVGKALKTVSQMNTPAFSAMSNMLYELDTEISQDFQAFERDYDIILNNLKQWAKNNGMTTQAAYDLVLSKDKKDLALVKKYNGEYIKALKNAREKKDLDWFINNIELDKELSSDGKRYVYSYTGEAGNRLQSKIAKRTKYFTERAETMYPANQPDRAETIKSYVADQVNEYRKEWDPSYEVSVLFKKQGFTRLLDNKEYYSEEMKNIDSKPEVLAFYNFYRETMQKFGAESGKHISSNFVPNIKSDVIESMSTIGLFNGFKMGASIRDMLYVKEYDSIVGATDRDTGELLNEVPLMHFDGIKRSVSKEQRLAIENELKSEGITSKSPNYIKEFNKRLNVAERENARDSKSRDLGKSMHIFAASVMTHNALKQKEAFAISLLNYLKTTGSDVEARSKSGSTVNKNKYTKEGAHNIIQSKAQIDTAQALIDRYFYGRNVQGMDKSYKIEEKDSEGNIIRTQAVPASKAVSLVTKAFINKSLGFNVISAFGNFMGMTANATMLAAEDMYFDKTTLKDANKKLLKKDARANAWTELIEVRTSDVRDIKANKISANKLNRYASRESLFYLMRRGDDFNNDKINLAMANYWGLLEGRFVKMKEHPTATPVIDLMKENDKGFYLEFDLDKKQNIKLIAKYRKMAIMTINQISGQQGRYDGNTIGLTTVGKLASTFRSWMPGLTYARFRGVDYNPIIEQLDAGRFTTVFETMASGSFQEGLKGLGYTLGKIVPYYKLGQSYESYRADVATKHLDRYKAKEPTKYKQLYNSIKESNPDATHKEIKNKMVDQFVKLQESKLNGFVSELRILAAFLIVMGLLRSFDDGDDDRNLTTKASDIALLLATRGYLEISFFFDPSSPATVWDNIIPIAGYVTDIGKAVTNTVKYAKDATGIKEVSPNTSPFGYHGLKKLVPMGSNITKIADALKD